MGSDFCLLVAGLVDVASQIFETLKVFKFDVVDKEIAIWTDTHNFLALIWSPNFREVIWYAVRRV